MTKPKYSGLTRRTQTGRLVWTGRVRYCPGTLKNLHKGPPRKIFLTVEGDPFHAKVLEEVFTIMAQHPPHRFQVLTKRADRLAGFARSRKIDPHIWLGVSVEMRKYLWRIHVLRTIACAVRWVSFEPLLEDPGTLDLYGFVWAVIGGESGPVDQVRSMHSDWARSLIAQCRAQSVAPYMKQLGTLPIDLPKPPPQGRGSGRVACRSAGARVSDRRRRR